MAAGIEKVHGLKDKMSDEIVINTEGWEAMARELMRRQREFYVQEADYAFDARVGEALAKEFQYTLQFDPSRRRAFFRPGSAN